MALGAQLLHEIYETMQMYWPPSISVVIGAAPGAGEPSTAVALARVVGPCSKRTGCSLRSRVPHAAAQAFSTVYTGHAPSVTLPVHLGGSPVVMDGTRHHVRRQVKASCDIGLNVVFIHSLRLKASPGLSCHTAWPRSASLSESPKGGRGKCRHAARATAT